MKACHHDTQLPRLITEKLEFLFHSLYLLDSSSFPISLSLRVSDCYPHRFVLSSLLVLFHLFLGFHFTKFCSCTCFFDPFQDLSTPLLAFCFCYSLSDFCFCFEISISPATQFDFLLCSSPRDSVSSRSQPFTILSPSFTTCDSGIHPSQSQFSDLVCITYVSYVLRTEMIFSFFFFPKM